MGHRCPCRADRTCLEAEGQLPTGLCPRAEGYAAFVFEGLGRFSFSAQGRECHVATSHHVFQSAPKKNVLSACTFAYTGILRPASPVHLYPRFSHYGPHATAIQAKRRDMRRIRHPIFVRIFTAFLVWRLPTPSSFAAVMLLIFVHVSFRLDLLSLPISSSLPPRLAKLILPPFLAE